MSVPVSAVSCTAELLVESVAERAIEQNRECSVAGCDGVSEGCIEDTGLDVRLVCEGVTVSLGKV